MSISFCSNVAQDITCCQYLGGLGEIVLWLCILSIYFIISFMCLFYGDLLYVLLEPIALILLSEAVFILSQFCPSPLSTFVFPAIRSINCCLLLMLDYDFRFRFSFTIGTLFYHINMFFFLSSRLSWHIVVRPRTRVLAAESGEGYWSDI